MAFKLKWSEEALEDIESIATYIEKDSPFYAKSVVSKFFEKAEILKDFAELGRVVPETNDINIREIFIYSYRLIYQINDDTILFIAAIHGKRLLENHQQPTT
jgi:addiction module RelE/StbE family toxin